MPMPMIIIAKHERKNPSDAPKKQPVHITPTLSSVRREQGVHGQQKHRTVVQRQQKVQASKGDHANKDASDTIQPGRSRGERSYRSGVLVCIDFL